MMQGLKQRERESELDNHVLLTKHCNHCFIGYSSFSSVRTSACSGMRTTYCASTPSRPDTCNTTFTALATIHYDIAFFFFGVFLN